MIHHPKCDSLKCEGDCKTVLSRRSFIIGLGATAALVGLGASLVESATPSVLQLELEYHEDMLRELAGRIRDKVREEDVRRMLTPPDFHLDEFHPEPGVGPIVVRYTWSDEVHEWSGSLEKAIIG